MEKITLTINGQEVEARKGMTVLEAAEAAGIYIPTLCSDPDLEPYGACRLCVVEIERMRGLPTACTTQATDGMVVHTETPAVNQVRCFAAELLIADHPSDCLTCPQNQRCELQKVAAYLGITHQPFGKTTRVLPVDTSNPFFDRDLNYCILCSKCVRVCDEILGVGAIDLIFRGYSSKVATFDDGPIINSNCVSCGECVVHCPVGALIPKGAMQPTREVETTCPYCGVGCQIYLGVRNNQVISVRGKREGTVNKGSLCVKGRFGIPEFVHHPDRLTVPLIKRDGKFTEATWDEALDLVASKLGNYKDQIAVISSAKCTNEENYVIQKFARAVLTTNNVDHCARLCHAPTVVGLVQSFGSGAMTNSINEIRDAACILAVGTNTTSAHPVIGLEIKKAVNKGAKLIVANPREIDLCRFADMWLQQRPGTDVALLMGMMRVIVDEGLLDQTFIEERCENFDAFKESLGKFDLDSVEQITGVPRDKVVEAARVYATNCPATILYAMGITQHSHGTDNVIATANLAMLTGNMGKPSTGVNPLRGQNNVQGACDMGALPNVYPGYQAVANPVLKEKFEDAWRCSLSPTPGLTLTEMFEAAYQKQVKALYIVGENPMLSDADANHIREALDHLEFLVVQDVFLTETARLADVVLPAATFAETDGTFTNTERRIQRVRKAVAPPGDSRTDWWITCQIAQRMRSKGFDFSHPSEIMDEIASLTPSYGGISYGRLKEGGLQWPCPTEEHPGTPILHTTQFTRGKGKFIPLEYKPPMELADDDYPLILTTERSLYHFHTGTMTRKVRGLNILRGGELVQINPKDASALGIADGDEVKVTSRRGQVVAKAKVTEVSPVGVIAMTFHFAESPTNQLTNPALDPVAKIPEFKVCAVRVEKNGKPAGGSA
ncbi:putative formate dehydrogenase [subsurface metagenome]